MTVQEIFELRRQGRVEEAYEAIRPMYAVLEAIKANEGINVPGISEATKSKRRYRQPLWQADRPYCAPVIIA